MGRFLPLYLALNAAGAIARALPGRWARREQHRVDSPGVSILVPERGTPDLLGATLQAAIAAAAQVGEATQIIVVVNGAAASDYLALMRDFPAVEWHFQRRALGYHGAIAAGLSHVRHAWSYLLNSDMRLASDALLQLLPYRQAQVFAITSQIFFSDPRRRREETGWSDFHWHPQQPQLYDREVQPGQLARGNLYPAGGSSLCRTDLLRRYVAASCDYSPFYWEDADWGMLAWSEGWETLFCPVSHAWHEHRATVRRFYAPAEIERVIARNALLFDLRHGLSGLRPGELMRRIAELDPDSRQELRGLGLAWRTFAARVGTRRAQRRGMRFDTLAAQRYYAPTAQRKANHAAPRPRVLLVSPFALFPPDHGGARRIAELLLRLSSQVDFILLSDEASLYDVSAEPWLRHLRAVHLVEGRGDSAGEAPLGIMERMQSHDWPHLRQELLRLQALYDPDIVHLEFMELARLVEQRCGRARWSISLHDVHIDGEPQSAVADQAQHDLLRRFDALVACSAEDAALLRHPKVTVVGNGAVDRRASYRPSPDAPRLLFMGAFRYAPNLAAIRAFIDGPWVALRQRFADLTLCILGGAAAEAIAAGDRRFEQPGIELVSHFVDPAPYLDQCTLSINPQRQIRGSSIKLIESLLAGRICVCTAAASRGFAAAPARLPSLLVARDIGDMAAPITGLLLDREQRHRLERADAAALAPHTWDAIAPRQLALYRHLAALPEKSRHR